MYEFFEHTADLGVRVRAPTREALFAAAAAALFAAIIEEPESVRPDEKLEVELSGDDPAFLLFDWLRELLYRFEAEHRVFGRFAVEFRDGGLVGAAWGEPFDPERHLPNHEVKAITYHELTVRQTADGWEAEVIVDI